MRRLLAPIPVLVVALLMALPLVAAAQNVSPVRIQDASADNFPDVQILVTAVSGGTLDASAFTVLEGDVEHAVAEATPVGGTAIEAVLVMDVSGSMSGAAIDGAKGAAHTFVDALPGGTRVGLVTFGNEVTVVTEPTDDLDEVRDAIDALTTGGETAFYDGVLAGLSLFTPGGADNLVVLTDGADTASQGTLDAASAALAQFDGSFFGVFLEGSETDTESLDALAAAADGAVAAADQPGALDEIFSGIAAEVASRYVLTYPSTGSGSTQLRVVAVGVGESVPFRLFLPVASGDTTTTTAVTTTTVAPTVPAGTSIEPPTFSSGPWLAVGLITVGLGLAGLLYFLFTGAPRHTMVRPTFRSRGAQTLTGVSRGLVDAADRVGRGRRVGLDRSLDRAGLRLRGGEYLVLAVALSLLLGMIGYVAGRSLGFGVIFGVLGLVVAWVLPGVLGDVRQRKFEDQLPDVLSMLASTIRTGYAPIQATELVAREMTDPAGPELARAVAETRLGRDYIDALAGTSERMESEDFRWVVEAMEINRDVGGDVSEILDRVADTIRARVQLRRLVSALTAEGRLSAWILVAVPFLLAWFMHARDPEFLAPLFETITGTVMLVGSLVLMVIGIFVIMKLIKVED